ncbi:hypothetical protein HNQ64_004621 [Prosthecobacter dejongeii]|uniref:Uncharacterized protein n=1 Tax=Prosthecobacter dejongeii TaxID=48465 RepID=A0A7W8DSC4_9BACT|nr:hypothetical protein [Prosthecobacter dejongeii]
MSKQIFSRHKPVLVPSRLYFPALIHHAGMNPHLQTDRATLYTQAFQILKTTAPEA